MSSGDDIEAGSTTTAESTTHLVGAIPSEQDVGFNGAVILRVIPQHGDLHPLDTLDGIHGIGSNPAMPPGIAGGAGVVGFGGANRGTGVRGIGGGGGVGVEAFGGNGGEAPLQAYKLAGAGLVARGGRAFDEYDRWTETNRAANGPGVLAMAGDATLVPLPVDFGNAGVFGQGGDAVAETLQDGGSSTSIVHGAEFVGAGVVGRGGTSKSNLGVPNAPLSDSGNAGAGVVGIAGNAALPDPTAHYQAGVFGAASNGAGVSGFASIGQGVAGFSDEGIGVRATSRTGPGVAGISIRERGGTFGSSHAPQIHLQPMEIDSPAEMTVPSRPGDLLATVSTDERGVRVASLHFCTSVGNWVQLA